MIFSALPIVVYKSFTESDKHSGQHSEIPPSRTEATNYTVHGNRNRESWT